MNLLELRGEYGYVSGLKFDRLVIWESEICGK